MASAKHLLQVLPPRDNSAGGFTLMEVLVVLVITAVLATLMVTAIASARAAAHRTACLSNQHQIGIAIRLYSQDNYGQLPVTTHSTGSRRMEQSWIYELEHYLGDIDKVRVCPADPPDRAQRIRSRNGTSYVLNDLVFDSGTYHRMVSIPLPAETFILFILSENKTPGPTADHIHGGNWSNWHAALDDVEVDRHRTGGRAPDRMKGSANYLFADGHVENLKASEFKRYFDNGYNPAEVPVQQRRLGQR